EETCTKTDRNRENRQTEVKEVIINTREENLIEEWIVEKDQIGKLKEIWHKMRGSKKWIAYTDGACKVDGDRLAEVKRKMGIGWVATADDDPGIEKKNEVQFSGALVDWPTALRAELGVIATLLLVLVEGSEVVIYTDSANAIKAIREEGKMKTLREEITRNDRSVLKKIENDLIEKYYKEISQARSEANVSRLTIGEIFFGTNKSERIQRRIMAIRGIILKKVDRIVDVTKKVNSKFWKDYSSLFFEHIWKFRCDLMVGWEKHNVEEQTNNGEGCSKNITPVSAGFQEGESDNRKRTFTEELGENILGWIKGFLKKSWLSESWSKTGKKD
ncbi:1848_t:CDS:2, partial [Gigaspora margarita]